LLACAKAPLSFHAQESSAMLFIADQIWQVWKNWTITFPIPDCSVLAVSEKSQGRS
jgi:hypothetical protein